MRARTMRLILGAALAASLLGLPSPSRAARETVTAGGGPVGPTWRWDPSSVSVPAGAKVTWKNPTAAVHHVTAYDGPWSGTLHVEAGGGTVTKKFKKPGTYKYRCDIPMHSELVAGTCVGQCGEVVVE